MRRQTSLDLRGRHPALSTNHVAGGGGRLSDFVVRIMGGSLERFERRGCVASQVHQRKSRMESNIRALVCEGAHERQEACSSQAAERVSGDFRGWADGVCK